MLVMQGSTCNLQGQMTEIFLWSTTLTVQEMLDITGPKVTCAKDIKIPDLFDWTETFKSDYEIGSRLVNKVTEKRKHLLHHRKGQNFVYGLHSNGATFQEEVSFCQGKGF